MDLGEHLDKLLPAGSVVSLKDEKKKLLIIGILQPQKGKVFDYMGVTYPEGYAGPKNCFLFNHENIGEVVFRGYEDGERRGFLQVFKAAFETGAEALREKAEKSEKQGI